MSEQREILFQKSMNIDKRNKDFAYLRRNVFSARTKGLYPASDFVQEAPDTAITSVPPVVDVFDILGSEEGSFDIKVIVETPAGDTKFYNLGSNSESNAMLTGISPDAAAFGGDGVYMAGSNDQIYKVQHVNGNTTSLGTLTHGANLGAYDGLYYWWIGSNQISKQLPSSAPSVAFTGLNMTVQFVDFYNDEMVLAGEQGGAIIVLFWDKSNTTLFKKRIVIQNANLLAMRVVDGALILVKSVGNSTNPHEQAGEIVVTKYDGEKFQRANSIKAGDRSLDFVRKTGCSAGSEIMLFSVEQNKNSANPDLYNNFVYKVHADGSIEALTLPPDDVVNGDVHIVRVFYNFSLIALSGGTSPSHKIYINENFSTLFADYARYNETVYITNFMNNAYNRHKLDGVGIVFEKLFQKTTDTPTGEKLNIYYRTSERDDFTLLGEVTAEKVYQDVDSRYNQTLKTEDYNNDDLPLNHQIYHITKMPDMSALPEFNEIQFKFESIRGFSVIQAWYYYTYLSRNTLN